jgi:hypothetical protein
MTTQLLEPGTWFDRALAAKVIRDAGIPIRASSLQWLASQGRGPRFIKVNGRAIYRRADLESWIAEQIESASAA